MSPITPELTEAQQLARVQAADLAVQLDRADGVCATGPRRSKA
jgi:hypothetical protein